MKVKFERRKTFIEVVNDSNAVMLLDPSKVVGILDLRSLVYYKLWQGVPEQRFSRYFNFDSLDKSFVEYNSFRTKFQEETRYSAGLYPWLEPNDPRRKMTGRQSIESMMAVNQ